MNPPEIRLRLPSWIDAEIESERPYPTVGERMELAIRLARRNVAEGTGGPFGAAVFDSRDWRLISPGVNLVVAACCSVAHAEIVALMLAQQRLGTFTLGGERQRYQLVSSTEPCAMCLAAIPWAGVGSLVCGARDRDARAIGFDEGSKPRQWIGQMEARGIAVIRDIRRADAVAVLQSYADTGGLIYNGGG